MGAVLGGSGNDLDVGAVGFGNGYKTATMVSVVKDPMPLMKLAMKPSNEKAALVDGGRWWRRCRWSRNVVIRARVGSS